MRSKFVLLALSAVVSNVWAISPAQNVANFYPQTGGLWKEAGGASNYIQDYAKKGMYYTLNPAIYHSKYPNCVNGCAGYEWVSTKITGNTNSGVPKTAPQGLLTIEDGGAPGPDFVVLGGIVDAIVYDVSPGFYAPGSVGKASCKTSPTTITETASFMTAQAQGVTTGQTWENSVTKTNKYSVGLTGGLDWFGFADAKWSTGYEFSKASTQSYGGSITNSWTDTNTYISSGTVGTTITPGTIGTTALTTPRVHYYGLFKMGRLFKNGSDSANSIVRVSFGTNNLKYRVFTGTEIGKTRSNENTPWWLGRLTVPVKYLKAGSIPFDNTAKNPVWYVHAPGMNVSQYKTYCNGDMVARDYAPSMKAKLCAAKIDTVKTCK